MGQCVSCGAETPDRHFCRAHWHKLPLKLRQRWWTETEFSRREPSSELLADVLAALREAPA